MDTFMKRLLVISWILLVFLIAGATLFGFLPKEIGPDSALFSDCAIMFFGVLILNRIGCFD